MKEQATRACSSNQHKEVISMTESPRKLSIDDALNRVSYTSKNIESLSDDTLDVKEDDIVNLEFPEDIVDFMTLQDKVTQVSKAVRLVQQKMKQELAYRYQGKAIRLPNKVIVGRPTKTYKPYDKDKVLDYLGDDWKKVVRPEFRITGIKAVAEERGDDPWVILESLFETVLTNEVSILPEDKAPKYLQKLDIGEIKEL
tara:strand:- start:189 stop:785 length:597 start_codon:yes stop_codon:yes gene_type:complete